MRLVASTVGAGCCRNRGLSMVEVVISTVIVAVMLVAALNTVGASRLGAERNADRSRGALLAELLMAEIMLQPYEDSALPPGSFGRSFDESATGNRSLYDDVDDYNNWSASPPQDKDGTVLTDLDGWRREVEVRWVNPSNLTLLSVSDSRIKEITVVVERDGLTVALLTAIRTASGPPDRD